MKALTIWQPWASLIIVGAKPFEFRGWKPPRWIIGQRIVIHASARRSPKIEIDELLMPLLMRERFAQSAAETCLLPEKAIPVLQLARKGLLPIAAGIGTAIIGEPR
ncbi:hypothetical protein, partial [Rhizorhabdus sp.]|uniref:hypothetical protein n=1 Tax=Rhizorhabdus sp. TaxID=1968843 RepID=UPI0035B361F6